MAQYNLVTPNGSGLNVRTNLNNAFQSAVTFNSGNTDPSSQSPANAFVNMLWADTGNNLLKQYTSGSTWEVIGRIKSDGTFMFNQNSTTMASAATLNIGAAEGETIFVTGTTNITGFDSPTYGAPKRTLIFQGALKVTYSASAIILPESTSITVSAGDVMEFVYSGSGIWQCTNYLAQNGFSAVPTGTGHEYYGDTAPAGYLFCDGSAVSRTTYAALFTVLGTKWGAGDGSTTFNLPDRRKRVGVGLDSTDTDFAALGNTGGEKVHALTIPEMPSHGHTGVTDSQGTHNHSITLNARRGSNGTSYAGWGADDTAGWNGTNWVDVAGAHGHNLVMNNTGGDGAHNNMQPYVVINYIIKC
ncbi:phage tail protein [Pectinatus frisingensis]|uniref:phage tail protein n=1 Tax=Pectinatus frisingensis TaxID=865 RepID=UPI0018C7C22C|nr:tail fiber protein [Pectinatus frisingensis]